MWGSHTADCCPLGLFYCSKFVEFSHVSLALHGGAFESFFKFSYSIGATSMLNLNLLKSSNFGLQSCDFFSGSS